MKKGIHPNWYKDATVIVNGEVVMTVGSTLENIEVEVWSGNHPFYTGNMTYIDIDNRVQKFIDRSSKKSNTLTSKAERLAKKAEIRKNKSSNPNNNITLKDMLKAIS